MTNGISNGIDFLSQALKLRAARQQILAGNLANADTPNYKARDFDFAQALAAATGSDNSAQSLARTDPMHLGLDGSSDGQIRTFERPGNQPSLDGNTVDTNTEQARFTDNAVHYEAVLMFLTDQIKQMQMAMQQGA